jgi:hypothetical protein
MVASNQRGRHQGEQLVAVLQNPMLMSALERRLVHVRIMSALPPKADMVQHGGDVRFVPEADIQPAV